jgi:tRNA threonylcarbamoyladenosine biosynthesis protein TsaE
MPILTPNSLEIISRSPEQTRRIGMRLGALLRRGDLVCLEGDLGSGKTTLVQGLASGWGSLDRASSPTFVLVNVYRRSGSQRLFHLDAYRLNGASEANELDIEAMLESGPLVVEWAEKIREALPEVHLWANLKFVDENQRDLVFWGAGTYYETFLRDFRKHVYGA